MTLRVASSLLPGICKGEAKMLFCFDGGRREISQFPKRAPFFNLLITQLTACDGCSCFPPTSLVFTREKEREETGGLVKFGTKYISCTCMCLLLFCFVLFFAARSGKKSTIGRCETQEGSRTTSQAPSGVQESAQREAWYKIQETFQAHDARLTREQTQVNRVLLGGRG